MREELRPVLFPLKRPVVSKVGLFDQWPMILIDLLAIPAKPGCGIEWDERAVTRLRFDV